MKSLLLLALASCCLAATESPNPKEIIRRSVEAIRSDWKQAPGYSFQERDVISKHGDKATVKTFQVLMIDGSPYNQLIAINDQPLSAGDRAEEERKLRVAIHHRERESDHERARRIAKYQRELRRNQAMLMDMVDAFDFKLAGAETVNGHECWVLDARPKPGYEPRDRETKVLAGMQGRLWIEQKQYQWVRVQAEVVRPVSFYGFLAKVGPGTRIQLEQEPVSDDLWLPKSLSVHVKAVALGFFDESSIDDETYRHYQPMPKTSALLTRP